jgi:segregation and condensation protein A
VTTVCRFLALLELFREAAVTFDQETPLGELTIVWTGTDDGEIAVGDEFDEVPAPVNEDGEAPIVPDEVDFLEPGEELTEPDEGLADPDEAPQPVPEPDTEPVPEPDTEPGSGPEEHETVDQ